MAAQLDYGYAIPKATPGQKVDISDDTCISRMNEEADGVMKFGMAVAVGEKAGKGVKLATGATADTIEGVVLRAENTEQDMKGKTVIAKGTIVSVITQGKVWVRIPKDVQPTYGAKAYVIVSGDDTGSFTPTEGTNVDIGAKFGTDYDADEHVAMVILNH